MKLCFVVDYRSAIARNWISYFLERDHEVHVISTFPMPAEPTGLASFHVIPVGFAGLISGRMRRYAAVNNAATAKMGDSPAQLSRVAPALNAVAHWVFPWLAPADAWRRRNELRVLVERIRPDVVHAMRIPAEGMLAAYGLAELETPLVVSVWGNDFTLFGDSNPLIASSTRQTMERADALHTDCFRDQRLAAQWGFKLGRPAVVLPGSGGVQLDLFQAKPAPPSDYERWGLRADRPIIFNPRNFRPKYVRNDVFFEAATAVLMQRPDTQIVCVGMSGNPIAEQWRASLSTPDSVRLLPNATRPQMAELFRMADISVSPSLHDGTPNTLLEAMACGAYPVAGNIESVREWIESGANGFLCDPTNTGALTRALLNALDDPEGRRKAAIHNRRLIGERADYAKVMPAAEHFYSQLVGRATSAGAATRVPHVVGSEK